MKIKNLEKQRYSIITDDLTTCYVCKRPKDDIHEIFEGARRIASMKYGCCLPVCRSCHNKFHNDRDFALAYKKLFQLEFQNYYPTLDFISIFHRNYI